MGIREMLKRISKSLDEKDSIREHVIKSSRNIIRLSSAAISLIHGNDIGRARAVLDETSKEVEGMVEKVREASELLYGGPALHSIAEYVEAELLLRAVMHEEFPSPEELHVPYESYLLGLADVAGELRRRVLDLIREGVVDEPLRLLKLVEEIYGGLRTLSYPDALLYGLRRKCDAIRGILESIREVLLHGELLRTLKQFHANR